MSRSKLQKTGSFDHGAELNQDLLYKLSVDAKLFLREMLVVTMILQSEVGRTNHITVKKDEICFEILSIT